MAFTDTEKATIRLYLGYPDAFLQQNPSLESAMTFLGERAEVVTLIQGILTKIAGIETRLTSAQATAGLKKASSIEWHDENKVIQGLRKEGRRLCAQLSGRFGVPILTDAFGESGFSDSTGFNPFRLF